MKINLKKRNVLRIILLIFAGHTILFLIEVPQVYFYNAQRTNPVSWWIPMAQHAWGVYVWSLMTPFILLLGYIFPITRKHLWRNLFLHLIFASLAGFILHYGYHFGVLILRLSPPESVKAGLFNLGIILNFVSSAVILSSTIIAIQQAYFYFKESQERAFRLQQAELEVLKMQLHPHFFFNTLNAISALIYRSPKDADRMITQLSDLFRISLKKDKAQEVTLKEELEFLEAYLQIHQTLMGKRLELVWNIEPETLDALVPNLILQPLVENAIQHGVAPVEKGGRITICAEKQNSRLLLHVSNNGLNFIANKIKSGNGVGLSNTRARLANLYGDAHKFDIAALTEGGVNVNLEIPFRERTEKEA